MSTGTCGRIASSPVAVHYKAIKGLLTSPMLVQFRSAMWMCFMKLRCRREIAHCSDCSYTKHAHNSYNSRHNSQTDSIPKSSYKPMHRLQRRQLSNGLRNSMPICDMLI